MISEAQDPWAGQFLTQRGETSGSLGFIKCIQCINMMPSHHIRVGCSLADIWYLVLVGHFIITEMIPYSQAALPHS